MCLSIRFTKQGRKFIFKKGQKRITAYKIISVEYPPIDSMDDQVKWKSWYMREYITPGTVVKSNRTSTRKTRQEVIDQEINKGIHVYLDLNQAREKLAITLKYWLNTLHRPAIVKVTCAREDYVAHDGYPTCIFSPLTDTPKEAVFTKVKYDDKLMEDL